MNPHGRAAIFLFIREGTYSFSGCRNSVPRNAQKRRATPFLGQSPAYTTQIRDSQSVIKRRDKQCLDRIRMHPEGHHSPWPAEGALVFLWSPRRAEMHVPHLPVTIILLISSEELCHG